MTAAEAAVVAAAAPDPFVRVHGARELPPAVALQQRRGAPSSRSTVGTLTTLSNSLRMLFSRAGSYPPGGPASWTPTGSPRTP
jgi:excinuclease UvrABC ATPase subunit